MRRQGIKPLVAPTLLLVSIFFAASAAFIPMRASAALTSAQITHINADLASMKAHGFKNLRFLTFTNPNDPVYASWDKNIFISFPTPTPAELGNLKEFFQLVDNAGMTYEVVLLMPDHNNLYYQNGVTSADYKHFIDSLWTVIWTGKLRSIYVGGDIILDSNNPAQRTIVSNHRQWIQDIWLYINNKYKGGLYGIELAPAYASLWDLSALSAHWIRANLWPQPAYLGFQFYPSTHATLQALGFEHNGVVDWNAVTHDWLQGVTQAASPIPVVADEVGLMMVTPGGQTYWTAQDQQDFLTQALPVLNANYIPFNIWEFADHPGIGLFGLMTQTGAWRPAASAITPIVAAARDTNLYPGIQYEPLGSVGLQFIMPVPPSTATIQGYRVLMPGYVPDSVAQTVSVTGGPSSAANPYHLSVNAGATYTVSVPTRAGYTIGYTLCIDSITCHSQTPTTGTSATVTIPAGTGHYADLWWHYTPIAPPPPPTDLRVSCPDGTKATLSWTPAPGATTYALRLDYKANNAPSCTDGWFCADPPDLSNDSVSPGFVRTIVTGQAYSWWVHSVGPGGWSTDVHGPNFTCSAPVIGYVDGVVTPANTVKGWACQKKNPASIKVNLYVGGTAPGNFIGQYLANQSSEPAVATVCGSTGTTYRYSIPLSLSLMQQHAGQKIYVYGISPTPGGTNALLTQSGMFTVPSAPLAPTATLTANGQTSITVNVGDVPTYVWSSTNGTSAKGTYTIDSPACGQTGTGPFAWSLGNTLSGSDSTHAIPSCQAGHVYTITYTVTGGGGQTARATIKVRVRPPAPTNPVVTCGPGGTSATFKWTSAYGAQRYLLRADYRDNNTASCKSGWFCAQPPDYLNNSVPSSPYTVTGITPGHVYRWWVFSFAGGVPSVGTVGTSFNCSANGATTRMPPATLSPAEEQESVPLSDVGSAREMASTQFTHTLARGWTGEEVSALQASLAKLGFYQGEITGYFGEQTEEAVKTLQAQNNVAAVGILGPQTRSLLQRLLGL